jgi:hypothetical protein
MTTDGEEYGTLEVLRVPADLDWPAYTKWPGGTNPFDDTQVDCPDCDREGTSRLARRYHRQWRGVGFDWVSHGSALPAADHPDVVRAAEARVAAWTSALRHQGFYALTAAFRREAIAREARDRLANAGGAWATALNQADADVLHAQGFLRLMGTPVGTDTPFSAVDTPRPPAAADVNAAAMAFEKGWPYAAEVACVKARCERP